MPPMRAFVMIYIYFTLRPRDVALNENLLRKIGGKELISIMYTELKLLSYKFEI